MDTMAAIMTRRSIRQYTNEPVSDALMEELLKAAMAAPSAGNAQPWRFIVIRDRQRLAAIPDIHPYAKMAPKAQVAVLICGDTNAEKYPGFWVQDCAAATQNLLLAAHANGLGAVWTGIFPDLARVQAFQKLFALPGNILPLAFVPLGFPDEKRPIKENFDSAKVFHENWAGRG